MKWMPPSSEKKDFIAKNFLTARYTTIMASNWIWDWLIAAQ